MSRLAALAISVCFAFPVSAEIVYDNTTNNRDSHRSTDGVISGDEVRLAGSARRITELLVGFTQSGGGTGDFVVRLYANDGLTGVPKTVFWKSEPFVDIPTFYGTCDDGNPCNDSSDCTNGLCSRGYLLSFPIPNVCVQDTFTWTVEILHHEGEEIYHAIYGPPTVGQQLNRWTCCWNSTGNANFSHQARIHADSDSTCPGSCGDGACVLFENPCNCPGDCSPPPSTELPSQSCQNGIDDDCDGLADCADSDCAGVEHCVIYVDPDASGPVHDGLSWCSAFTDLQDALDVAFASTTIRVADGTYVPTDGPGRDATFHLEDGVILIGGYAGCGADAPSARDTIAYESILSGDRFGDDGPNFENYEDNARRIVTCTRATPNTVLDGFTLRGSADGAALYNTAASPAVLNCLFEQNGGSFAGAARNQGSSSPIYSNCIFFLNLGYAVANIESTPVFKNCSFLSNIRSVGNGGAIVNANASHSTIINSLFAGNSSNLGGR